MPKKPIRISKETRQPTASVIKAVTPHGIRNAEMMSAIHILDPNKKTGINNTVGIVDKTATVCYTIFGEHDELRDISGQLNVEGYPTINNGKKSKIYAKAVLIEGKFPQYFVRLDSSGHFFNPIDIFDNSSHAKIRHAASEAEMFAPVKDSTFIQYVKFLKTRNDGYLRQAERNNL
jgi:hypothetical protein